MSTNLLRTTLAGIIILLILSAGYGLTRSGKPYNTILFNIHKLAALGSFIWLIVLAVQANRASVLPVVPVLVLIFAGLVTAALIVSGGLLSGLATPPAFLASLHHILPYLAVSVSAAVLYFLWFHRVS